MERAGLTREKIDAGIRGKRNYLKIVLRPPDNIQRIDPYRAGRAQYGYSLHPVTSPNVILGDIPYYSPSILTHKEM
jgi:hypothetical protein